MIKFLENILISLLLGHLIIWGLVTIGMLATMFLTWGFPFEFNWLGFRVLELTALVFSFTVLKV